MFNNPKINKCILYEYGKPTPLFDLINYCGGIWQVVITPTDITVTDDNGHTGYYTNKNATIYNVQFVSVNQKQYSKVNALSDLLLQYESWYYDTVTTTLYISFYNFDPPLDKQVYLGAIYGFSKGLINPMIGNTFYDPRLQSVFGVKKSKDPLFYGILKMSQGSVNIINTDGEFDDWGTRNLYRQPSKILIGEEGFTYSQFKQVFTGIIGNYSYTWNNLQIKNEDVRSGLTVPLPYNQYTKSEYSNLDDSNVGKLKPIAYGKIFKGQCICIDQALGVPPLTPPAKYTFHFMDTEFNDATAIDTVYVDNVKITHADTDLVNGTFTITAVQLNDKFDSVTIDFQGSYIFDSSTFEQNGVEIIKDIMLNYGDTAYIDDNYDLVEMASASTTASARKSSLYIKAQETLKKQIEKLCIDIDGLFFVKDSGVYSIRIYNSSRTPVLTILKDEWIGEPGIENNTDEFLSSCIIKYSKNQSAGSYRSYVNTVYEADTIFIYNSAQSKEFETTLTDSTSAGLKSESIMAQSKIVTDIVKRSVPFYLYDLEIMDFIYADPKCRRSGTEHNAIWEVIGIDKNLDSWSINLTLRYISEIPT